MAHPQNPARKPGGLTRAKRLTKRAEFDSVLQDADIRLTRYPVRLVAKVNTLEFARLGLTVSKKNVRMAVDRNRVKRLLREWFRVNGDHFRSYDIVLSVREYVRPGDRLKAGLDELLQAWDQRVGTLDS
ncbi:MAG: ribonuclease P protein component [Gammaproteobacteria bacterium]|nr:ribonuclease P protein component [Gammaproteobacteria bacterium]